jgi:hypothetical protein
MTRRAEAAKWAIFGLAAVLLVVGFLGSFQHRSDNVVIADDGTSYGAVSLVTIFDNGNRTLVQTRARTVGETLRAARISIEEFDRVEPALEDHVGDGYVINIYRAQPVLVRDGTTRTMAMSGARDPWAIVNSLGFVVSEHDNIFFRSLTFAERFESGLKSEVVIERTPEGSGMTPEEIAEAERVVEMEEARARISRDRAFDLSGFDCVSGEHYSLNNEACAWHFFRSRGFTAIQTAGIMGNIQQEHRFRTADVPGGLGIMQWMGGRRLRLLEMENPFWISTQLEFTMTELNGTYWRIRDAMFAAETIEDATRIFQNQFLRCGVCKEERRIQFAHEMYRKYTYAEE